MAVTRAINIMIIHGIGWGDRGTTYGRPLEDGIRREFDRVIRRFKLDEDLHRAAKGKQALRFECVCWDPVTQTPQDALLRVMFGRAGLRGRLSLSRTMRRNMIGLLGDVTAYERDANNKVYQAIHAEVQKCAQALREASSNERDENGYAPLSIIGHSLGSVIASDFVWDHALKHSHLLDGYQLALHNMFLMGSPMAVYALRGNAYGGKESIREALDCPVQVEPEYGMWLNMYDRQDAIGFPLEPIESYKKEGVIDREVKAGNWMTGWNLGSHTGYWKSEEVWRFIGHKLAIDWARINDPGFDYEKSMKIYRKELKG